MGDETEVHASALKKRNQYPVTVIHRSSSHAEASMLLHAVIFARSAIKQEGWHMSTGVCLGGEAEGGGTEGKQSLEKEVVQIQEV